MNLPPIVSEQEWQAARDELLVKEKEATRTQDALAAERRRLPMVEIDEDYVLEDRRQGEPPRPVRGAPPADPLPLHVRAQPGRGLQRLLDGGRPDPAPRAPARPGHVLRSCLAGADRQDRAVQGAHGLDEFPGTRPSTATSTSILGVSPETPRVGEYQDGETFGLSVFLHDGDRVFRTYFTRGRGVETLGTVWTLLDVTPLGRQEEWEDTPEGRPQTKPHQWWRHHDRYEGAAAETPA